MSKNDLYAIKEAYRRKLYEEAYESAEAKAWRDSLAPAERERAEALGLLQALPDTDVSSRSLDTIPLKMQPQEELEHADDKLVAAPLKARSQVSAQHAEILATLGMENMEELKALICQDGNPRLRSYCLSYLLGKGSATIEELAKKLGMSKQAFHYHVRQVEKQLGLPPMGNQRKQSSREAYRNGNRRR